MKIDIKKEINNTIIKIKKEKKINKKMFKEDVEGEEILRKIR